MVVEAFGVAYVRTVKTAGATSAQIVWKYRHGSREIEWIFRSRRAGVPLVGEPVFRPEFHNVSAPLV